MALDPGGLSSIGTTRFDYIGVDCSLNQKVWHTKLARLCLKDADKFFTNNASFLFRVANRMQCVYKIIHRIDWNQLNPHRVLKYLYHLRSFTQAKQSIVYKYGHQLLSHSPVNQSRRHTGINPTTPC